MDIIIENWYVFVAFAALVSAITVWIVKFVGEPSDMQLAKVKEWLKFAVAEAEKAMGSGTGQLKLRYVYDMFVDKYGWIARCISFEQFSVMVDEALVWLNGQLNTNINMKELINECK